MLLARYLASPDPLRLLLMSSLLTLIAAFDLATEAKLLVRLELNPTVGFPTVFAPLSPVKKPVLLALWALSMVLVPP